MSEEAINKAVDKNSGNDAKARMLTALAKKQKGQNSGKLMGPSTGSKVGAGQTKRSAPKLHRRKSGSD